MSNPFLALIVAMLFSILYIPIGFIYLFELVVILKFITKQYIQYSLVIIASLILSIIYHAYNWILSLVSVSFDSKIVIPFILGDFIVVTIIGWCLVTFINRKFSTLNY